MKCAKKQKILCRRDFPLADFSRNEQVIEVIFIDQFNQLGRKYRYLESAVEKFNARIANLNKTVASLKSTVANHLCLLEEKDLTISTQLSIISTQATTILDTELFKQLLEFTITSQEQSISELKLTKLQLEENARFNFGQLLPDGQQCGEQLHLPCQNSLQLGTLPEYPLGGLNMSTSPSSNSGIIPCVLPGLGLVGDAQGDLLHVGEADDLLYEGEVLLLVSTEGSKSGVSLPCYTPASTTNSPPVNHQQIYCLETKMWLIHATSASTSRGPWRTATRVRPGETGGRRRR